MACSASLAIALSPPYLIYLFINALREGGQMQLLRKPPKAERNEV